MLTLEHKAEIAVFGVLETVFFFSQSEKKIMFRLLEKKTVSFLSRSRSEDSEGSHQQPLRETNCLLFRTQQGVIVDRLRVGLEPTHFRRRANL